MMDRPLTAEQIVAIDAIHRKYDRLFVLIERRSMARKIFDGFQVRLIVSEITGPFADYDLEERVPDPMWAASEIM